MYDAVMEKIGKPVVFNICVLGTLIGMEKLVRPESLLKVLEYRIPSDFLELNKKAFHLGLELAEDVS